MRRYLTLCSFILLIRRYRLKRLVFLLVLLASSCMLFAEEIKVKTGDVFGASMLDYFTPVEKSVSGGKTCVSSIKNVEKDLWCIAIIAESKSTQFPKTFEYYLRVGDTITVYRFPDIQKEVKLKFKSITWNEAVVEVVK